MDYRLNELLQDDGTTMVDELEAHSLFDDPTAPDLGDDDECEEWFDVGENPRRFRANNRRPDRS